MQLTYQLNREESAVFADLSAAASARVGGEPPEWRRVLVTTPLLIPVVILVSVKFGLAGGCATLVAYATLILLLFGVTRLPRRLQPVGPGAKSSQRFLDQLESVTRVEIDPDGFATHWHFLSTFHRWQAIRFAVFDDDWMFVRFAFLPRRVFASDEEFEEAVSWARSQIATHAQYDFAKLEPTLISPLRSALSCLEFVLLLAFVAGAGLWTAALLSR